MSIRFKSAYTAIAMLLVVFVYTPAVTARDLEFEAVSGQTGQIRELSPTLQEVLLDGVISITELGNAVLIGKQLVDFSVEPGGEISGFASFYFPTEEDRLDFTFDGQSTLPEPGVIINFDAELMFEGGTGRFEHVTGEGGLRGSFRFGVPEICGDVAGTGNSQYRGVLRGLK